MHGLLTFQDCPASEKHKPQTCCLAGASVRWASRTSFAQKNPPEKTGRDGIVEAISVVLLFAFLASTVQESCRQSPWLRSSGVRVAQTPESHHPRPAAPSSVRLRRSGARRFCPQELSGGSTTGAWPRGPVALGVTGTCRFVKSISWLAFFSSTSELEGLVPAHWCAGGIDQDPEVRIAPHSPGRIATPSKCSPPGQLWLSPYLGPSSLRSFCKSASIRSARHPSRYLQACRIPCPGTWRQGH